MSQSTAQPALFRGRRVAAALMLLASAFIATSTFSAKLVQSEALGPGLPPLVVTFGRFAFALAALGLVAALLRPSFGQPRWRLHLARTALGGTGVTLMFAAVAAIPLADATAISFLNPVFAMIFAIVLLGERVGPWRWVAAGLSLCGAVILLRPGGGALELGALFALGAAVVLGLEISVIKRLSGRERPLPILLINNIIGTVLFGALAATVWAAPAPAQWLGLASVGLSMAAAQVCFVNALARAEASFAVPFTYAVLVFASLWDSAVFGIRPDTTSLIGSATILAGGALLAWREGRARGS